MTWYAALILAVGAERIAELVVARRHAAWAFAHGGIESGRRHYPAMVALHAGLLVACLVEAFAGGRQFIPWLGWMAFGLVVAAQALRWWCIAALGNLWNTRIIIVPGSMLVRSGPYRLLRHPNYVAVAVEGAALPLVHSAWITAVAFTGLNAILLLGFRIPAEERALRALEAPVAPA